MTQYSVYVLRNPKGQLYVGFTTDLDRRVRQHCGNEGGWTKGRGPWTLVHSESFASRAEAVCRERALKQGRANQNLHTDLSPDPDD
jgi:putative endonuclease